MKEQARKLALLSRCDFELHQLRHVVSSPPKELINVQNQLQPENKKILRLSVDSSILQSRIEEHQRLIQLENRKLELSEKQLNNPKGQKVFLKVKNNIAIIRRFIKDSEMRILGHGKKIEVLNERAKELQNAVDSLKEQEAKIQKRFFAENQSSEKRIAKLEKERPELEKGIKPNLLWKYKKLLDKKLIPAVSEVDTYHCMACSVSFPPRTFQELLSEAIGECPNCLRIIVEKLQEDEEESAENPVT